jgi:homoserine dehydrogenase
LATRLGGFLVPTALDGLESGDKFIEKLAEYDQEFYKLGSDPFKENKVLRFVERWVSN